MTTHAQRMLTAIEGLLEGRDDVEEYTIAGRSLKRMPMGELMKMRDKYKAEVAAEQRAERIAAGLDGAGRVMVRL